MTNSILMILLICSLNIFASGGGGGGAANVSEDDLSELIDEVSVETSEEEDLKKKEMEEKTKIDQEIQDASAE